MILAEDQYRNFTGSKGLKSDDRIWHLITCTAVALSSCTVSDITIVYGTYSSKHT